MDLSVLLYTGILIATGLLFSKLTKIFKLPNVTGYLLGGVIIGPSILNLVSTDAIPELELISVVALGFIAFSIGNELKFDYFRKVGIKPVLISIFEASFGVLFVFGAMLAFFGITGNLNNENLRFSLILASIAAATAPASTLMVIRQFKAKGKLTETLMSVVAIDDSVAVILFGICIAIANAITPGVHENVIMQILHPIIEIGISLGVGALMGVILVLATKWFTGRGNRISLVVTSVFVTIFVANLLDASSILASMTLGMIFTNYSKHDKKVNELIYFFTPPIYIVFFVLSGAELQLNVLLTVGVLGLLYMVFRFLGKYIGATTGATITKMEPNVRKYLGFSLIPQAGVAIGLTIVATQMLPDELGAKVKAIVLASSVIYGLIGPIVTKYTLRKAGEITIVD